MRCGRSSPVSGSETKFTAVGDTVRAQLAGTLTLLAEVMREPSFPAAEFETLQREHAAELEETRTDPESVGERALARYGNPYPAGDVRYEPTLDEELRDVRATRLDDVKGFYRQFVGGAHAELAIVGDFDAAAVRTQLTELFGAWPSPAPYARVPEPLVPKAPTTLKLDTPDKANAALFAELALPVNDTSPDYPALMVANKVLGGGASSRLWKRIREQDGLSYGVHATLRPSNFEPNTPILIEAIFAPDNQERLRAALADVLTRAVRDGFTATEVAEAKAALLQQRRLARTQDPALAAGLVQQAYLDRTFAYAAKIDAALAAVTPAEVNAALRKYVKPDAFAFVYAGDFAKKK